MSNELVDLSALAGARPASAFVNAPSESLSDGIGQGYGVLGYKGKVWSLRYRGETYTFTREDDGSPLSFLDVVILRQAHAKSKSYYPGGYDPKTSEGKRPTCASMDGVVPDGDVAEPQSDVCALCEHNKWKYDPQTQRRSRACTDYKRLAVMLLPKHTKGLFNGEPLAEPIFLRIPPASLGDLGTYGDQLNRQQFPYYAVITRISFVHDLSYPKFKFSALQALSEDEGAAINLLREDPLSLRITAEDMEHTAALTGPTSNVTRLVPAVPREQVIAPKTVTIRDPVSGLSGQATVTGLPAPEPKMIEHTEDEGPSEADDDVDAKIARLLVAP